MSACRLPCLLLPCLLIGALVAGGASARTWRVAKDGSGDFETIQPAVDWCSPGDTVLIAAGRYAEAETTLAYGSPARVACVLVRVDSLTFLGEEPGTAVIGPQDYVYWNYGPVGIGTVGPVSYLRVEGLDLVNCYGHIIKFDGEVDVAGCRASVGGYGVKAFRCSGGTIVDCIFESSDGGITFNDCNDMTVRRCQFTNCATRTSSNVATAMTSIGISYYDCVIDKGYVGIAFSYSSGEMHRCEVRSLRAHGVVVNGPGSALTIEGCTVRDGMQGLYADYQAVVTGSGSTFEGSFAAMSLRQSQVTLHDCHILNGGGFSVRLIDDWNYPVGTYDLSGNWWGVADSTQIAEWNLDANDNETIGATVEFMPFLDHPVPTEAKSWGELKALFR